MRVAKLHNQLELKCTSTTKIKQTRIASRIHRAPMQCQASLKDAATPSLLEKIKIVGMGSAGIDYLALVAAYPRPDDKLRTERLELQGGGNCANALTGAARLGLSPAIVTKIGDDGLGADITSELEADGVDTQFIIKAPGSPSPFTYIIVDRQGGTRTCIHTPGEPMRPEELTPDLAAAVLNQAALVYFDGRLTEAALVLAQAAKAAGIPVLVEAERLRPGLEDLLQFADCVVTSANFPGEWTGEGCVGDAMTTMFVRLPNIKWMITTLGKKGSVLFERPAQVDGVSGVIVAEELIETLFEKAAAAVGSASSSSDVACISGTGLEISPGGSATANQPYVLQLIHGEEEGAERIAAAVAAASAAAAAANADGSNAAKYAASSRENNSSSSSSGTNSAVALVTVAQAAKIPVEAVVDTTGAGDSFIGSIMYTIATKHDIKEGLKLGGVVAACKCTALGARAGLPQRTQLAEWML